MRCLTERKKDAESKIKDFIKYDYLYKDHISEFDSKYGADNPIRKAYEYSHDPNVYPYWILDDSITFTHKGKSYTYYFSKEADSHGASSEYDYITEVYNGVISDYYDSLFNDGTLDGVSVEKVYEGSCALKKDIRTKILNPDLENYAKNKLGLKN